MQADTEAVCSIPGKHLSSRITWQSKHSAPVAVPEMDEIQHGMAGDSINPFNSETKQIMWQDCRIWMFYPLRLPLHST